MPGAVRVFAILGDPVGHSLSPVMHTAAFTALGLRAAYVPLRTSADRLPGVMRALAEAGGGGNVTVPHKGLAAQSVDRPSPLVRSLGACNTFLADGAALVGENTDVAGVLEAVRALAPPRGPWLLLGTGGSAHAVVAAAAEMGAPIAVHSRDATRAAAFASHARAMGLDEAPAAECVLVVNCTPLGLGADDPLPLAAGQAPRATVALDLVYAPGETAWVRACRAVGWRAADGREMLVRQGASALERWFPGVRAPVEVMRAAVAAALRVA